MSVLTDIRHIQKSATINNIDGIVIFLFALYGLVSQYFLLSLLAGAVLIFLLKSLWRPYIPPVLLFMLALHWLQVFFSIVYADVSELTLENLYGSSDLEPLFVATFLHIGVMAYVMNSFLQKQVVFKEQLLAAIQKFNVKNLFIGYGVSLVVIPILSTLTKSSASLYQFVLTLSNIKYIFVSLLLFHLLLIKSKHRPYIIALLLFDFILSFASFFSDFKALLILNIIAYITITPYFKSSTYYKVIPSIVGLFFFMSFWSFVKGDYRLYLNQGSNMQVVRVSNSEALGYLLERAVTVTASDLQEGTKTFLSRLQYMERYSEVYNNIPEVIPYQKGSELESSIRFLLVPRFLDPNKGVKDASTKTAYYTRKNFHRASQGTSISMGYFCDLFIDFGLVWMIIPLIGIAYLIGSFYKYILKGRGYNIMFSYAILISTFLSFGTFESDMLFFLGMIRNNLAFLVIGYIFIFPSIHKFIIKK